MQCSIRQTLCSALSNRNIYPFHLPGTFRCEHRGPSLNSSKLSAERFMPSVPKKAATSRELAPPFRIISLRPKLPLRELSTLIEHKKRRPHSILQSSFANLKQDGGAMRELTRRSDSASGSFRSAQSSCFAGNPFAGSSSLSTRQLER
jgi:hypothetical protein